MQMRAPAASHRAQVNGAAAASGPVTDNSLASPSALHISFCLSVSTLRPDDEVKHTEINRYVREVLLVDLVYLALSCGKEEVFWVSQFFVFMSRSLVVVV